MPESLNNIGGGGCVALFQTGFCARTKGVVVQHIEDEVVLGGEVAVPCHPQSAIAGLNPS